MSIVLITSELSQETVSHKDLSPCPVQFISQTSYAIESLESLVTA